MLRKISDNLPLSRPYLFATAIAVLIFSPTWVRLVEAWLELDQAVTHGLPTAIIFCWIVLIHPPIHAGRQTQLQPYRLAGSLLLVATTIVWGMLELVRIDTLSYLMLPAGLITTSWALLGLARTLTFLPYMILLSLSMPFWADTVPLLVDLASLVVGTWVGWFGMTALIEGNSITLPYGRLIIEDGCSGFRYFAISIMLAVMTSILNDYRWRGWLITLLIAGVIGLIANWIRITILVIVAYETNMESEMLADHDTMGWIVFAACILPALYFSPVRRRKVNSIPVLKFSLFNKTGVIAVVVALVLGPVAVTIMQRPSLPVAPWTLELPGARPAKADGMPIPVDLPETLSQEAWRKGNLWMLLAQSQKTAAEDKLVPYLPQMFDTSLWQLQNTPQPGLHRYRNIRTREQIIIGQSFQTGSQHSWSYKEAKLLQIPAMLAQERQFSLVIAQMKCGPRNCDLAQETVQQAITSVQLIR